MDLQEYLVTTPADLQDLVNLYRISAGTAEPAPEDDKYIPDLR